MKKIIVLAVAMLLAGKILAEDAATAPADAAAKYTATLEGRAADILKELALTNAAAASRVHDLVVAQYRALNAWHNANDAKLKSARGDTNAVAEIRASLKVLHDAFLSGLVENLTPALVEQVKDKMTYGKVRFTLAGYLAQYPDLSATHQAEILRLLKQAREDAMDAGSAAEKTAIFQKYKGRINNYLSQQGIHPQKTKTIAPAAASPAPADQPPK
jgi:hypothetical protein